MNFSDFNFNEKLRSSLQKKGFVECTPIQEDSIPLILEGRDVAGLAQTGTGKTAAYLLPLIERVYNAKSERNFNANANANAEHPKNSQEKNLFSKWRKGNFILILVPTRELSEQVYESCKFFLHGCNLSAATIYGGSSYERQRKAIARGVEFVVATPGRLIDLFKENFIDLKQVRAVVFDEADRMFDMGFKDDMKYILSRIPDERQFLVYSATLNFDVLNVAYRFGASPVEINISKDRTKAENVDDKILHVGTGDKPKYLLSILKKYKPNQTLIFSNYKNDVGRIEKFLTRNGYPAMGTSSLLSQPQRNKIMSFFKAVNDKNILVATDVAARGLDVKNIDLVINYDTPGDPENYIHRIGRTGRAGEKGIAFSLVSDTDLPALSRVESYLGSKLPTGWIDEKEIIDDFIPIEKRQHRGSHQRKKAKVYKNSRTKKTGFQSRSWKKKPSQFKKENSEGESSRNEGYGKKKKSYSHKKSSSKKFKKKSDVVQTENRSSKKSKIFRGKKSSYKGGKQSSPSPSSSKVSSFVKKLFN